MQGSVADAAGLSARKIPGTPNGISDLSEWPRPRARALPLADTARAQSVPWSADDAAVHSKEAAGYHKRTADDAAAPSARKMSGTATGIVRRVEEYGIIGQKSRKPHKH